MENWCYFNAKPSMHVCTCLAYAGRLVWLLFWFDIILSSYKIPHRIFLIRGLTTVWAAVLIEIRTKNETTHLLAMLCHTHGRTENVSMPYQQFQSCTSNELHFVQLMHVGSRFITKIKDFSLYGSFMFKLMHAIVSRTVYGDCVQCTTHLWRLVQSLPADGCRESPHIFFSFLLV